MQQGTPSPLISRDIDSSAKKKKNKQFGPIFKAFQGRLQEWNDLDANLEVVIGSIANLRDRIWWESCELQLTFSIDDKAWKGYGFRARSNGTLTEDDVNAALTYDLLQHEKMMSGARTLISSMSQAQESMARRLDEFMTLQLEEQGIEGEVHSLLNRMEESYLLTSGELYRKQVDLSELLDAFHDGLLDKQASQRKEDENPRTVARNCCRKWPSRRGLKNQWLVMDELLKLGSIKF